MVATASEGSPRNLGYTDWLSHRLTAEQGRAIAVRRCGLCSCSISVMDLNDFKYDENLTFEVVDDTGTTTTIHEAAIEHQSVQEGAGTITFPISKIASIDVLNDGSGGVRLHLLDGTVKSAILQRGGFLGARRKDKPRPNTTA